MDFIVNESGCRQLSQDMLTTMKEVASLVSEIDAQNGNLRAALGEDYESIAASIRYISSELLNAHAELNIIINDMNEYMARVHEARVSLG